MVCSLHSLFSAVGAAARQRQHRTKGIATSEKPPKHYAPNSGTGMLFWVPLLWVLDWLVLAVLFPPLNNVIAFSTQP